MLIENSISGLYSAEHAKGHTHTDVQLTHCTYTLFMRALLYFCAHVLARKHRPTMQILVWRTQCIHC